MIFYIILCLFLILLSAYFAASETALTSVSLSSITEKAKKGNKNAKLILSMLKDKSSLIIILLMANTFINIFFSTLTTSLSVKYLSGGYIFLIGLANAIIILLFGEMLPKSYAFNRPMGFSLRVASSVFIFIKILKPFTKILLIINNIFFKLLGSKKTNYNFDSLENLRGAIELFQNHSDLGNTKNEREMLHSLLDLHDIAIGEIMIHRKNVFCVDIDTPKDSLIQAIIESNYTKVPVYKDSKDNIIGILYTKEILKYYFKDRENFDIKELIKKPTYFPETSDAFDLLIFLQKSREKMIIVVDEYGGFMGIVSVSDILEEIVGELKSTQITNIQKINNSYIVNGDLTIRDLNRKLSWKLPDNKATTMAGLILYETGRIPNTGNIFALHNFKFEILEKKKQQIRKIKITPIINK